MDSALAQIELSDAERDERVRRDLQRSFHARLGRDAVLVLAGHAALIVLVAVLVGAEAPRALLRGWIVAIAITTILRAAWMRYAAAPAREGDLPIAGIRATAALQALTWSVGVALLIPALPVSDASILLMVLAGIGAGSIATLAADSPSLHAFLIALSLPLPFGILAGGTDRPHLVAAGVVVVFVIVMLMLYRRAHQALVEHTRTTILLAASQEAQAALILELKESLARVKVLGGLLPMCASCKKIRDDQGYWNNVERYVSEHSDAKFSHSVCPDCYPRLFPGYDRPGDEDPRAPED
jgi:hypothetical protein